MTLKNILIADDHPLIRAGLVYHLEKWYSGIHIVEVHNGISALRNLRESSFDLAFLDINMPGLSGLNLIDTFVKENPDSNVKLIVLSIYKDLEYYTKVKASGAHGYILKEFALEEIQDCLEFIKTNEFYSSPSLSKEFNNSKINHTINTFSQEEIQILNFISEAKTTSEISKLMLLSKKKLDTVKKSLCEKIEIPNNEYALMSWAYENKHFLD